MAAAVRGCFRMGDGRVASGVRRRRLPRAEGERTGQSWGAGRAWARGLEIGVLAKSAFAPCARVEAGYGRTGTTL